MARQAQGRVFSVQYGSKTMYWVADSPQEAKVSQTSDMHHHDTQRPLVSEAGLLPRLTCK